MLENPPMKTAVYGLLTAHNLVAAFEADPCFSVKFEMPNYMPLVIERLALFEEISISHFYIQNGDLMRDPEIVFDAHWRAVEITQDAFGNYGEFRDLVADGGRAWDVEELAEMWAENITAQGWETARCIRHEETAVQEN